MKEYVDGLAALGDRASLDYAISLSQGMPSWTVRLMEQREKLGQTAPAAAASKDND